jgi:hypothetical protein
MSSMERQRRCSVATTHDPSGSRPVRGMFMRAGNRSRKKAGLLGLLVAGGITVLMITGATSASAVTDFRHVPKCPGIPGCRHSLDQRAGWEGWQLNNPSHCAARVMKPFLNPKKQVASWTEVFCQQNSKLTVRSRLFANYLFADLLVDQKGCSPQSAPAPKCVHSVNRGFNYYYLACPKSGGILPNRLYYSDIIFYKGTKVSTAFNGDTKGPLATNRSRDAKLSPYCAF